MVEDLKKANNPNFMDVNWSELGYVLCDSIKDGVVLLDDAQKVVYWNSAAQNLFGYSREEFEGLCVSKLFLKESVNKVFDCINDYKKAKTVKGDVFEVSALRKDGGCFFAELSLSFFVNKNRQFVMAVIRDISKEKLIERKLREYSEHLKSMVEIRTMQLKDANERLVKAERLATIGEVAGMVGHDLRNPLVAMKGAAYHIGKKYGQTLGAGVNMLRVIDECICYSDKIVDDLLEFSRELKLSLEELGVSQVLEDVYFHVKVPENIEVEEVFEDFRFVADRNKMGRVFANIIRNSIEAMPHGGKLVIKGEVKDGEAVFSFSDNGVGMSREIQSRLLNPLFTTKAKGMGFGLAICKRILNAHGGKINIESQENKGTKITLNFPVNLKP